MSLLDQWLKEKWTVGQYTPSENFKAITNHSCVCRPDNLALIAVTGPAEDIESHKLSDLIAAAPELLSMLKHILGTQTKWPEARMSEEYIDEIRALIAKAEGH